jgi:integrase
MAHVEDRRKQGKGWRVRYRGPDGRERSRSFARKVDADKFAATTAADLVRGQWIDPEGARTRFGVWADRVMASTVDQRPSTRARDESYYRNHVAPTFGALPLGAIDHLSVRDWIATLSASGLAPATVHKCHQVLAKVMRAAVDAGLIAASPCERQALPKIEREEMRFLGPDEVATLAAAMDARYRPLVLVGAYGGLRAGELFGLRRSRVDLLRGRVDVVETLVEVRGHHHFGPPKTRAGHRSVPLPRSVVDELGAHVAALEPGDLVFPAPERGPMRASLFRRRMWAPATQAAGLDGLRMHDLRHSAVALWIAAGAGPKEIAVRAGHSSVSVVLDRYGHLLPGTEERVTDALDVMARGAAPESFATVTALT